MTEAARNEPALTSIALRIPNAGDGEALHRLVQDSPPLDENSVYCNLLQCTHFAETSIVAASPGALVGFISGYLIPARPDTLFVWQVAVSAQARGLGLATRMLNQLLERSICAQVRWLETTITEANSASRALFQGLATKLDTALKSEIQFDQENHFGGKHDSEYLLRIGPIS